MICVCDELIAMARKNSVAITFRCPKHGEMGVDCSPAPAPFTNNGHFLAPYSK